MKRSVGAIGAMSVLIGSGFALGALTQPVKEEPKAEQPAVVEPPRIEVVFVLDTTGSMSRLIEGAKQKIWSIANAIATGRPHPRLYVGLVAYRDKGDAYITKRTGLTDDLDAVYKDLMGYKADGGGDGPESVNQALHEAITTMAWTTDAKTLRLVYLVGDAPPHMDYSEDVKYPSTCERAAKAGIIINTVQCGSMAETRPIWQEIARLAEGEYLAIAQSGGMAAVATPYDEELAKLGADLEATLIAYGDRRAQLETAAKSRASRELAPASRPAAADRAMYKAGPAGGSSLAGRQELVKDAEEKKVDPGTLPEDQLPAEMKSMSPDQRRAYVAERRQKRAEIQEQIRQLGERRDAFVKEALAKAGHGGEGLDGMVIDTLQREAAKKGIDYHR